MTWLVAPQPLFLATVFAWSGLAKAVSRDRPAQVAGSALHRALGARRALAALLAVACAELALAGLLAFEPGRLPAAGAAVLSAGFIGYLAYSTATTPEASCGCLGKSRTRISWRSFARAGLLLAAALVATTSATAWWKAEHPVPTTLVVAAELAAFVALSAELDRYWLTPLRKLRVRLTHPLAGAPDVVPLQASVSTLLRSDVWRDAAAIVASDVLDHWEADGWRILLYTARVAGRPASAVFAVPLEGDDPAAVRFSLVDEQDAVLVG